MDVSGRLNYARQDEVGGGWGGEPVSWMIR